MHSNFYRRILPGPRQYGFFSRVEFYRTFQNKLYMSKKITSPQEHQTCAIVLWLFLRSFKEVGTQIFEGFLQVVKKVSLEIVGLFRLNKE